MKIINPDDPASPLELVSKWVKNHADPEGDPIAISEYHKGLTKFESAVIHNFIQNYAGKGSNSSARAGLAILEIKCLFDAINGEILGAKKTKVLYPELKTVEIETPKDKTE